MVLAQDDACIPLERWFDLVAQATTRTGVEGAASLTLVAMSSERTPGDRQQLDDASRAFAAGPSPETQRALEAALTLRERHHISYGLKLDKDGYAVAGTLEQAAVLLLLDGWWPKGLNYTETVSVAAVIDRAKGAISDYLGRMRKRDRHIA